MKLMCLFQIKSHYFIYIQFHIHFFISYPNLFDSFMILFFMPLFYSFGKQIFYRMQKM